MTVIVLRCILICLFIANVVEAAVPWRPPTKQLSQEELEPILRVWDKAIISGAFKDYNDALGSVIGIMPEDVVVARSKYLGGALYLAYSNPEIIDRVLDFYVAVVADREASPVPGGYAFPRGSSGEGHAELMMALADTAQSTFDPRIYDTVVRNSYGDMRNLYLATVNPERTLDYLFKCKTGDKFPRANNGKGRNPNYFYIQGKPGWGMSVENAYAILAYMIEQSPQALRDERQRAVAFVVQHAKHYAQYVVGFDYYLRYDALDILEFLGTVTEATLVEEIIRDAEEVDLRKLQREFGGFGRSLSRYEQIQDKGRRIIEILRRRSPSQR